MLMIKTPLEMAKRKQQYGLTLNSKDRAQLILFGNEENMEGLIETTKKEEDKS